MTMAPTFRKFALTAHVTASVGWAGALAVFLAHALASVVSQDEKIVRAASLAMALTAWFVILPLALASLATGLVQALGTAWGLVKHYWILFKLALTGVATTVLLLKLGPIDDLARAATQTAFFSADLVGLRTSLVVHAIGGLLVLIAITTLAIYKPEGTTANPMPRWARFSKIIGGILILLIVLMFLGGQHGPVAHASASVR